MIKRYLIPVALLFTLLVSKANAQESRKMELTFQEVIKLAREQSPDAIMAKHRFRANYWEYRTHIAQFRPSISLESTIPAFSRSISENKLDDGSYVYTEEYRNRIGANLRMQQVVPFTGGQLFINSGLERTDLFGDFKGTSYLSTPVSIGYSQPILLYNDYKWQRKIEPLKYEEARKNYISALEDVSLKAVNYFFDLALAQQNMQVAEINYSNADTLYKIAQGRYQIGTIAENELMQMELSFLNAGSDLNAARVDLEMRKFQLRSFLGFNENIDLKLIKPKEVPELEIAVGEALGIAMENNPDIISYERQLLEAQQNVAEAKSEKGLQANLFASVGLTQSAEELNKAYLDPQDQQRVTIGLELPILDWGLGKGRYKMAQSSQQVINTTVQQARTDFEQNVYLNVMQFNLQDDQLLIAAKSDTIAQRRYDVTKQRFLIGKVDVLDLNVALSEKDVAKRNYISALRNYWSNYYQIRKITLYDFLEDSPLEVNFDEIID